MKNIDKEALFIWITVIVLLAIIIFVPYWIAKSDLPFWFKYWLLK